MPPPAEIKKQIRRLLKSQSRYPDAQITDDMVDDIYTNHRYIISSQTGKIQAFKDLSFQITNALHKKKLPPDISTAVPEQMYRAFLTPRDIRNLKVSQKDKQISAIPQNQYHNYRLLGRSLKFDELAPIRWLLHYVLSPLKEKRRAFSAALKPYKQYTYITNERLTLVQLKNPEDWISAFMSFLFQRQPYL
jgi:hypothetical protein